VKKMTATRLAVMVTLVTAGALSAHHSLAAHDTTKAVRVKGTVVQFHPINPHSFVYVEEKGEDGQTHRWAVEGPSVIQLARTGIAKDFLKPGDVIEVCGYAPKESVMWQIVNPDSSKPSLAGRLITAELLVMPDGKQQSWGDYGFHKCFEPGYKDQHSSK
jgi:Family of unknown function (DUF6152)